MQFFTSFITIKTLLLFSFFTLSACGGGGGEKSDPVTTSTSSSSLSNSSSNSSTVLSPQTLTFAEQIEIELQVNESLTNIATGQGTGPVTYKSSDDWVAVVNDSGIVIARNPGVVTITANKAADSRYLDAAAHYSLTVSDGKYLSAWIGSGDTLLNFPAFAKGAELYRTSSGSCDFTNYIVCADSALSVLQNYSVKDPVHLNDAGYFLLKSDHGQAKVSVNLNANFSSRFGQAIIGFKGRLWIIGGSSESVYKNDVWSSVDGVNWNLETPAAAFSPRTRHRALEHNGRLYLIGGIVGQSGDKNLFAHDIWSSLDGIHWVLETNHPTFSNRWDNPFISFNNKLWLIGGRNPSPNVDNNDIWSSVDGKNWTLELANAAFSPRGGHKLITYQNKLWLIGSYQERDVWSSVDGINWIKEAETTGFPTSMQLLTPVVLDEKLWLLGDNSQYTWFSQNGVTWTHAPTEASYADRVGATVLTFDNQIWLIGGEVFHDKRSINEVWVSADAHTWKLKTNGASFTGRAFHNLTVHNDNLFLIGGDDSSLSSRNDVWSSVNGINWVTRTASAAFAPRKNHKVASFNNKLWLIGGSSSGYPNDGINDSSTRDDVWSSLNGVDWTKESDDLWRIAQPGAETYRLEKFKGLLWLIGSIGGTQGFSTGSVWSSDDGLVWQWRTKNIAPGFPPMAGRYPLIEFKNQLWLIGADYGSTTVDVWSSGDGVSWQQRSVSGGLPGRQYHQLAVFKDKLWMIGGMGRVGSFDELANDVWSSEDGIRWVREVASTHFSPRIGHQVTVFNDRLVLVGGKGSGQSEGASNEVWSSTDGVEWRRGYQALLKFTQ